MSLRPFTHSTFGILFIVFLLGLASNLPFLLGLPRDHLLNWVMITITSVVFFVAIPFIIIKRIYQKSPSDYGFRWPEISKRSVWIMIGATILTLVLTPFLLKSPEIRQFYLLPEQPLYLTLLFIGPLALIYYLSEEFLFRGFLTFVLYKNIALWSVILVALLFAVLHMGKPSEEILWAIVFSVIFSWVSLETKSFLPAAMLHFLLAFLVSVAVNFFIPEFGLGEFRF